MAPEHGTGPSLPLVSLRMLYPVRRTMPFTKGVSGNPAGRPRKGQSLADLIRRYGDQKDPTTGKRRKDLLALMLWDKSLEGDLRAAEYVADRLLGRPAQEIRLESHQPSLVFQIIDPRLPLPAPAGDDDAAIEGEARELPPEDGRTEPPS